MQMFRLDWDGGAGAIIDVFRHQADDPLAYQLRYGSPFHQTMRAPAFPVQLTDVELAKVDAQLREFAESIGLGGHGGTVIGTKTGDTKALERLANAGGLLFDVVLPRFAQNDLRRADLFLEIGTDERLLHYPWELMCDEGRFLCLHHHIGRFVNITRPLGELIELSRGGQDRPVEMNVLLICVSAPKKCEDLTFSKLTAAEEEREAVLETLQELGIECTVLNGKHAEYFAVRRAITERPYQIMHFCGHAFFDERRPLRSALVLDDGLLTTASLTSLFKRRHPTLCFVNGCETVRSGEGAASSR